MPPSHIHVVVAKQVAKTACEKEDSGAEITLLVGLADVRVERPRRLAIPSVDTRAAREKMGTRVCPLRRPLRSGQKNRRNVQCAHFIFPIDLLRKGKFIATRRFARCEWTSTLILCLRQDE